MVSPARRDAPSSRSPSATLQVPRGLPGGRSACHCAPSSPTSSAIPTPRTLAEPDARAFVSQALKPYLIAAVADRDARRPTIVVAGDDRAARELAQDLRAWLQAARRPLLPEPRRRLRVAPHAARAPGRPPRRRARRRARPQPGRRGAGDRRLRRRALREGPRPGAAPARLHASRSASCSTSTRPPNDLVAAGYERVDQVEDRGQFAVRGGLLDVYPATEERAVRVDLFDDEIESLRWFSTFTQRSLGDTDVVEIAPAAELAAEHRELAEIAALENPDERPDIAELLPVGDFRDLLDLLPDDAELILAAEEDTEPALRDHWDDVCAAFHDTDAHHLYVKPDGILAQLDAARAAAALLDLRLPADRVPRAGRRVRRPQPARGRAGAGEARPLRLHGADHVAEQGRRRARRVQPRARQGPLGRHGARPRVRGGQPARRLHRARDQARGRPRAPADPPPQGEHAADARAAAACCAASPTCARATSSSTRTTASRASPASTRRPSAASPATT